MEARRLLLSACNREGGCIVHLHNKELHKPKKKRAF